jgi:hypothetical protein
MAKKTKKELEAELKIANAKVAETQKMLEAAKEDGDGGGDGGDGGHDDADADKKLVKSMIKKHLGDDSDGSDEEEAMYKAAMESYKEMGYQSEAAADAAGHAMKLAKHESKKSKEAGGAAPGTDAPADGAGGSPAGKKESDKVEHKESERERVKLQGRIASLEEKLTARDVEDHIESTMANSGLPRQVTKTFRESVKGSRTTADVDSKFKLFMEAYRAAGGEAGVPNLEKTGGSDSGSVTGFGDCLSD